MSALGDQTNTDLGTLGTTLGNIGPNSQSLLNNQQNGINTFNNAFSGFINDPKNNLTTLASNMSDTLGLPTLRQNANTINTQVANLPFTYRDATRGFDVNNNQLNRVIGQRVTDLTPAMTTANNALATGEGQLNQNMQWAGQDIQNKLLPYQSQQALMQDQMARQATMFTTGNQQELDGLIAKINAGVTLTNAEADRANTLAIAEAGYQNALDVAKTTGGFGLQSQQLQNQFQKLTPGSTLVNTFKPNNNNYTAP